MQSFIDNNSLASAAVLTIKKFLKEISEVEDRGLKIKKYKNSKLVVFSGKKKDENFLYIRTIEPYEDFASYISDLQDLSLHFVISFPYCLADNIHNFLYLKNRENGSNLIPDSSFANVIFMKEKAGILEDLLSDVREICKIIGINYLIEYSTSEFKAKDLINL